MNEELKVATGDELRLGILLAPGKKWQGTGHVLSSTDGEIALQLRGPGAVPIDQTIGFTVEFVWKVIVSQSAFPVYFTHLISFLLRQ
jgi:hypothetical protein